MEACKAVEGHESERVKRLSRDNLNVIDINKGKTGHGQFLSSNESPEEGRYGPSLLPPKLFQNPGLTCTPEASKMIDKKALINKINYIHFMDEHILVNLHNQKYDRNILAQAFPEPCLDGELTCRWNGSLPRIDLKDYQVMNLIIADGKSVILIPVNLKITNKDRLTLQLPDKSFAVGERSMRRYECQDVTAEVSQDGFQAKGELLDFSPSGFRIKVIPKSSCSFNWFDSDEPVSIHLQRKRQTVFSGICRCVRQQKDALKREMVFVPVNDRINRFQEKQVRNQRHKLVPSPIVTFYHPLFKKRVQLEVCDISTNGFSVCERIDEGVLMPGMVIPELTLSIAGSLRMTCTAQVIHRFEKNEESVHCGFSILDMDIKTYSRLANILTSAIDPHSYISNEVDTDALWEFFFDTGFIYPTKYSSIQSHKESFKKTYQRLYQENPEIARHFTYQENGRIYGHISMVMAYNRSWLIHHHAARSVGNKRVGVSVLEYIMHYVNDMYRLPSARMDHLLCYFRPENRFPNAIFGNFARTLNNVDACSLDLFSYSPSTSLSIRGQLPEGWTLGECSALDLWVLDQFYSHHSGGLFMDTLGLGKDDAGDQHLKKAYSRVGFSREWKAYSLTNKDELNAVMIVDQSNIGFNISELLNSIKIFVINQEGLSRDILSIAIEKLTTAYQMEKFPVPVLIYPFDYVEAGSIPYEKQYQLWILNVKYVNKYMEYMQRRFKIGYKQKPVNI